MRKIFIDGGAHCGCSRRYFKRTRKEFCKEHNRPYDDSSEFEIFSFEPDPDLNVYCDKLINQALWTKDQTKTFYKFGIDGGSSLNEVRADVLVKTKKDYFPLEKVTADCINFDAWIKENFTEEDYIIVKFDIEAAEYDILPHMFENGSIDYLNEFFVEWHHSRIRMNGKVSHKWRDRIRDRGIFFKRWNAMQKGYCIKYGDIKYHE